MKSLRATWIKRGHGKEYLTCKPSKNVYSAPVCAEDEKQPILGCKSPDWFTVRAINSQLVAEPPFPVSKSTMYPVAWKRPNWDFQENGSSVWEGKDHELMVSSAEWFVYLECRQKIAELLWHLLHSLQTALQNSCSCIKFLAHYPSHRLIFPTILEVLSVSDESSHH